MRTRSQRRVYLQLLTVSTYDCTIALHS